MKLILILLAALMSFVSSAAPHYHRTRPRVSTTRKIVRAVPWKTVLAGGAAAGTIIAAYKISDGVEEGIKTVAKEKPETVSVAVSNTMSALSWVMRLVALLLVVASGCLIGKKVLEYKSTHPSKGFRKWKSL